MAKRISRRAKRAVITLFVLFTTLFICFLFFVNRFVEPILRDRLHTLIIQGSDSLYTYELGSLKANFFGGNVEVQNLQIRVDSTHYKRLEESNALPSLTMQLDLQRGRIKGLGVATLIFSKKINVKEISSKEADVKLFRHLQRRDVPKNTVPLWKALQPAINSISIDRINLDGIKLLYRNADTSESVKLQFDRCVALFDHIEIDSTSAADTTRIAFAEKISMQFYDLKFRTPDSAYKMKAEVINYSSANKLLEIKEFKIQPTFKKEEFFERATEQESHQTIEFEDAKFTNLRIDRFIHSNVIAADSVIIQKPEVDIYTDKTLPPNLKNKFGKYPHQLLLRADAHVMINGIRIVDGKISQTERSEKTGQEGNISFSNLNVSISNVTNYTPTIKRNPQCIATASAMIFDSSPIKAKFIFYLDSTEGEFYTEGEVKNVTAAKLNSVAEPLANIKIQSLNISTTSFKVYGDDYSAKGNVRMRYNDLAIIFRKKDEETGANKTKKFLTKLINKFSIYSSNPSEGVERVADNVVYARVSSKAFFGVVWKTVFAGMQNIMMKTGRYE